jgi:hypothetical protein
MSLVTRGLGIGALVTGGLGIGVAAPPPPPPAPAAPIIRHAGGGGSPFVYDPISEDSGQEEESFARARLSWADRISFLARRWARAHPGQTNPIGPLMGGIDAGKETAEWGLTTAGGVDAGRVRETWGPAPDLITAGGVDGGKKNEEW